VLVVPTIGFRFAVSIWWRVAHRCGFSQIKIESEPAMSFPAISRTVQIGCRWRSLKVQRVDPFIVSQRRTVPSTLDVRSLVAFR